MARPRKENEGEKKEKRLSLAFTPSMHADVIALAQMHDVSANDFVETILEKIITKNRDVIDEFKADKQRNFAKLNIDDADSAGE